MTEATATRREGTVTPEVVDGEKEVGAREVSTSKGTVQDSVSRQWWNRPADERYNSISDLLKAVQGRRDIAQEVVVSTSDMMVVADPMKDNCLELDISLADTQNPAPADSPLRLVAPTHWSFGQLCSLVEAPAWYLRGLGSTVAAINLQYGIANHRPGVMKALIRENGTSELSAMTGAGYGRVWDEEVVRAVQRIAGNGTGDTRWKIPGVMDWGSSQYNPHVKPSTETTTLFASDRDVFMFLCDDTHPIEIGKLPSGEPDLLFRGFYVSNSETGSRALRIATMYLRAVCQNRLLWGCEGFQEISIRHSQKAPERFADEVVPVLNSFADASDRNVIEAVNAVKSRVVATTDDERIEWLTARNFTKADAAGIVKKVEEEEGHKPSNVWDFVQGITAVARSRQHQDSRIALETKAGGILNRAFA